MAAVTLTCAAIADADVPDSITVTLAATATALAADPADCPANQFADAIGADGVLACNGVVDADVEDTITASNYVLKAGDTMSGALKMTLNDITVGSGTGLTVNDAGSLRSQIYKATLDFSGLSAAALTATHTIATLPAGMKIVGMIADTTTVYTGGATSDADLIVGILSGDEDGFIVTHDVDGGTVTMGDAAGVLGDFLNNALNVSGGRMDWTGTTVISVKLTTVGANTDALTQGSTTYYIETVQVK